MSYLENRITRFTEYYNTIDLTICTSGQQFSANKVDGPYAPEFHVLHYVTAGKGTLIVNEKKYAVSKGDIFFLPENVRCCYYGDKNDPYTYYWISFKGKYSDYLLKKSNITEDSPVLHLDNKKIEKKFYFMFRDMKKNNLAASLQVLSHLYDLFSFLIKNIDTKTPAPHYLVEKGLTYINHNFSSPITITYICKVLNCDRSYFQKLFIRQTGISPKDYLLNSRLAHSKTLLKQSNMSIEQISEACGMEYNTFKVAFKRRYGCSATQYRKKKKEETIEEITKIEE